MRTASYESQEPESYGISVQPSTNVTRKLLWANGIVFAITFLLGTYWPAVFEQVVKWLGLSPSLWYAGYPAIWQLWTYGFLHGSATHILFNMLALYFFGTMLEEQVGSRRFILQYFAALAAGGIVHLAIASLVGYAPVIGASGAVLYCIIASAVLLPNARVLFFFVPLPLKVMALILVGLDIITILSRDASSSTASDVHLAGAALGFIAARRGWIYFDPAAWRQKRSEQRAVEAQSSDEERLDRLLERIHREGIHSLSQRDKDFLSRMSKRD